LFFPPATTTPSPPLSLKPFFRRENKQIHPPDGPTAVIRKF
jgi:hypothetical protein